MEHNAHKHFVGEGSYDSDIDVLLHSDQHGVNEVVVSILCKHDHPDLLSHHDVIMSECFFPATSTSTNIENLARAPRLTNTRMKIDWSPEGVTRYEELVGQTLKSLRETWLVSSSTSSISILLKMTNHVLFSAASATNKAI